MRGTSNYRARNLGVGIVVVALVVAMVLFVSHYNAAPTNSTTSSTNSTTSSTNSTTSSQNALQLLLRIGPYNPVLGSRNAPVTIYEFGDFQCPTCDRWFKNTEPVIVQNLINTNQTKLVWKDFIIFGPDSTLASKAAYAAGEQGKFWQFYDTLYTNQQTPFSGWANATNLEKFAQNLGLNMTQFNQSFNSDKYTALISSNYSQGQELGIGGTPTFVIVGPTGKSLALPGAQPYSAFQQAINAVSSTG